MILLDTPPLRQTAVIRRGLLMLVLAALLGSGCSTPRWMTREEPCVLDPGVSKQDLIAHLNKNIVGTESRPGLSSWQSARTRLHVDGIPISLPASIAVEAPRNLRLMVSNPGGGQEVDIGSNSERFWIWTKESGRTLTTRHEDVALALEELQMPVHIHPDWLMEVFGVVPLESDEFILKRPDVPNGMVELVASRQSPLGQDVERVIKVNVCRGHIVEHSLRLPGGKVLARARLGHYATLPDGIDFPHEVVLEWPDAQMQMVMEIRGPNTNAPALAHNTSIWRMPDNAPVVDIGAMARRPGLPRRPTEMAGAPARHQEAIRGIPSDGNEIPTDAAEIPGKVMLSGSSFPEAPRPAGMKPFEDEPFPHSEPFVPAAAETAKQEDKYDWARQP